MIIGPHDSIVHRTRRKQSWRENFSTAIKIQNAFERAGIQFIEENECGGIGVRIAKTKRKR